MNLNNIITPTTEGKAMKVQVEKEALIQVLQKVQSITEKKTGMPILANTLIKVVRPAMDGVLRYRSRAEHLDSNRSNR